MQKKWVLILINFFFVANACSKQKDKLGNIGTSEQQIATILSFKFKSIKSLHMSAKYFLNSELKKCIWIDKIGENDCKVISNNGLYPMQYFSEKGELLSQGVSIRENNLKEINQSLMQGKNEVALFNYDFSRCFQTPSSACDFKIFSAFKPVCPKGAFSCDKADSIELYYFIVPNAYLISKKVNILSNYFTGTPVRIRTNEVIVLPSIQCQNSKFKILGYEKPAEAPICGLSFKAIKSYCEAGNVLTASGFMGSLKQCKAKYSAASCYDTCDSIFKINYQQKCIGNNLITDPINPSIKYCENNRIFTVNVKQKIAPSLEQVKCEEGEFQVGTSTPIDSCNSTILGFCFKGKKYTYSCANTNDIYLKIR